MKILIAEDDRLSRTFLEEFMKDYGSCDSASDGMETLDLILEAIKQKEPYDLLCLDIMMPKVDGFKVLKVIRGLEQQYKVPPEQRMKIIMMTAIADVDYVDQAFTCGCDAYASKPINMEKVQEVMQQLGLVSVSQE
ncbi:MULTISPECIES: response regulator [Selenomonas]|uniref:Response regulator n=1 Tax=Selenomonas ruminis TaxID=2593411 RepID=A0A5D6VWX1_9FIRM|nr:MULTISPECIES: response regulator [unclassified Selenomonas]MBQ1868243.1 response regulator [Selenomonas sp.]TYZ19950.1 response regulator [Selenomonas sp. mPRGC5]